MKNYDIIVVGCGLSGAVVARHFAEKGKKVCIWERRDHIAGNMFDYCDEHGILVHKYGPHIFHAQNKKLYEYMCRFTKWSAFDLVCMANFKGKTTPTPFNFQTIDDFYSPEHAEKLKNQIKETFNGRDTATVVEALESPCPIIKEYAQFLFDNDYSLYTAKQWGVSPAEIDPSVLKRVPLRFSYDTSYFDDEFQVMPKISYVDFFDNILAHENITVELNTEALDRISISSDETKLLIDGELTDATVVYTGALDELFKHKHGSLPYRSLRFEWKYEDIESKQDSPVVAYPEADDYTRITEYKKLPVQDVKGTTYAIEYPLTYTPNQNIEPYYPVLTQPSQLLYKKYEELAIKVDNFYCCGRLADFKYYNMDQALERALQLCNSILID